MKSATVLAAAAGLAGYVSAHAGGHEHLHKRDTTTAPSSTPCPTWTGGTRPPAYLTNLPLSVQAELPAWTGAPPPDWCSGTAWMQSYVSCATVYASCSATTTTSTTSTSTATSPSTTPSSVGDWSYYGCYVDCPTARTLISKSYTSTTAMTLEACVAFCKSGGYIFAGTEYSQECYCGNYLTSTGTVADAGDCNMACTGNASEPCGAGDRLTIYTSGATPISPVIGSGSANWHFLGCYSDSVSARTLTTCLGVNGGGSAMTVNLCTSACQDAGYSLAGVEYGEECYCGYSTSNGGGPASDGNVGCNMPCAGNASEFCGGPNRLDLYTFGDPCSTPVPANSIVQNGGFECGIAPWQQQIVSVANAGLTSPGHNSQFAYEVDQTGTPNISGAVPVPAISQTLTTVPGKTYTISFDTYITGSFAGFVGVKLNGTPYMTVDSQDHLGPGVWNTNSLTHTADSTSMTLTFEFLAGYVGAHFVIDNVSVV